MKISGVLQAWMNTKMTVPNSVIVNNSNYDPTKITAWRMEPPLPMTFQNCVYYGEKEGFNAGNFNACGTDGKGKCAKWKFMPNAYNTVTPSENNKNVIPVRGNNGYKLASITNTNDPGTSNISFFMPWNVAQFGEAKTVVVGADDKLNLVLFNNDTLYTYHSL
jgi:hypothetical protein